MTTVSPPDASPEPSGWAYALHLPHDPRAPRVARMTLRTALMGHGLSGLLDTAELLACELVTNAFRHSDGPASMRVRCMERDRVRVGVWDTNPVIPAPFDRQPGTLRTIPTQVPVDADSGRGLFLIQAWADRWGGYLLRNELSSSSGKLLWFELGTVPTLTTAA
ncbi:ATP-binding protein [Streptomyces flavidovirens]|uniref:ATP-binding protein n=1 Tax=Streptomyces flavidovirens TaxID=67298 RepID=UPI0036B0F98B